MTLKIRSRSPKSNHSIRLSQGSFCASLVKIHPVVQEISCRQKATLTTPTPTGITPKTICPPPLRRGDIIPYLSDASYQILSLAHLSQRLTGELIVYPCCVVRPSVRRSQFQRSSPLKPLGQSKPNFMWSILRKVERKFI